jgi:fumarate reductase subunit C
MSAELGTSARTATKTYRPKMAAGWWTKKRHYFMYMVREFTALPLALWLLWLLYEIQRAGRGPTGYYPPHSTAFVIFSVICLLFALYHSFTFLSLAGVILHFKVLDKPVPARLIVLSQFGMWLVASVVIGAVLIGFGVPEGTVF